MAAESPEFSKWRSYFWPIHRSELKKFVPMLLIFCLIAFNYNLLRAAKDTLVITAKNSGAETIPFIKVWAILPMALLLTFIFTRLANRFSREKVFYIMMTGFLSFFFIFTFFLYPARDTLHPNDLADKLQLLLPSGFKGLITLFRNWTFTLFYVMSELWSTAILTVLFWGFANEVTTVPEAKRFYGLLATGANCAAILSGQAAIYLSGNVFIPQLPYGKVAWEQSVLFLNCAVIICGVLSIILFYWLNKHVILPQELSEQREAPEKIKMSMRKNFAYLSKSKYLICIALIVLTYNIAINLIEVVWKNQIKEVYPDPSSYNIFMGEVLTATGIIATIVSILFTNNFIQRFSWTNSALIPPVITLITGALFFFFTVFPHSFLINVFAFLSTASTLYLSVMFGALQNSMTRASKLTLYDATKELAFIPLSKESKLKGKAAIDGVGSRLGKSGGSVIHQGFLLFFATLSASAPYIAIVFFIIVVIWVFSVISLGKQFDELVSQNEKLDIPENKPEPSLNPS